MVSAGEDEAGKVERSLFSWLEVRRCWLLVVVSCWEFILYGSLVKRLLVRVVLSKVGR